MIKFKKLCTAFLTFFFAIAFSIQSANITKDISNKSIVNNSRNWKSILNKCKLSAHKKHIFKKFLIKRSKENYLRINIYPDGGISRIRAFGNFVK